MPFTSNQPPRRRGRPPRRRARKLAATVREYCEHTQQSRSTVFRQMERGDLRFIQVAPGFPRRIPFSEYRRLGFDVPTDDDHAERPAAMPNMEAPGR